MSRLGVGARLPLLYFIHLPKTGGTSLRYLLRHAYGDAAFFPGAQIHQLLHYSLPKLLCYRCFVGHFGRTLYSLFPPQQHFATMTILRDPVERSISQIKYMERLMTERGQRIAAVNRQGLLAWRQVVAGQPMPDDRWLNNRQTRALGVDFDLRPYLAPDSARSAATVLDDYEAALGEADLAQATARAVETLHRCAVIGVTERFEETALLLCDLIGVYPPAAWPTLNRAPERAHDDRFTHRGAGTYPAHVMEYLEAITARDRELYNLANTLLDERMAAYHARPRRPVYFIPSLRVQLYTAAHVGTTWAAHRLRQALERFLLHGRLTKLRYLLTRPRLHR